jgi:hypothetical protein
MNAYDLEEVCPHCDNKLAAIQNWQTETWDITCTRCAEDIRKNLSEWTMLKDYTIT